MKLYRLFFLLFLFTSSASFAQQPDEELMDLGFNGVLIEKLKDAPQLNPSRAIQNSYFYINDTLSLPFIDDFSTNRLPIYYPPAFTSNYKRDSLRYSFRVNGNIEPTYAYMNETSWTYQFDQANQTLDSTAKSTVTITFFENRYTPSVPTDTLIVWPSYYRHFIAGGNLDSVFVEPNRLLVLETDTSFYIRTISQKALWINNKVFINNDFPYNPVTYGVATFDGLDSTGYPYNFKIPGDAYGLADELTSKPIDLSSGENIFFSFYFQPQGRGNAPETGDSLVLEFRGSPNRSWKRVWFKTGYAVGTDTSFQQIMIAVNDTAFRKPAFQFRFKNYATLSGSVDHWHIDYIQLDKDRSVADTNPNDVAFVYPVRSLLKDYYSMPWKHYKDNPASYMKTSYSGRIRNLFKEVKNTLISVEVLDKDKQPTTPSFNVTQSDNVSANSHYDFQGSLNGYVFPPSASYTESFHVFDSLYTNPDYVPNSKFTYHQKFFNYYAYDDGTAESGYGINGAGGKIGYKFTTSFTDTLIGLQVYFARMVDDAASPKLTFKLTVWNDAGGKPGGIIYQKGNADTVFYDRGGDNLFHGYKTDPILLSGTFYVGFVQTYAPKINIGLDRNTNRSDRMFYNVSGIWYNTQFTGTWMIRPVFGSGPLVMSEEEIATPLSIAEPLVYPNPANDYLNVFIGEDLKIGSKGIMVDVTGKVVLEVLLRESQQSINTKDLKPGLYFLNLYYNGKTSFKKIVITH